MKALIIVASILIPLLVLLFAPLRLSLVYDGRLGLRLSYLFLRFSLYPRKAKSKKKKAKKKKTLAKKHPQGAKADATAGAPPGDTAAKTKEKRSLSFADVRFLLRILRELLASILDRASRHIRLVIRRLRITLGGEEDAARAAIEYGLVSQGLSYLIASLDATGFLREGDVRDLSLDVNYLEKRHSLEARIDIVCPLVFLIGFALRSLTYALTARGRWTRYRAKNGKKPSSTSSKKETHHG